MHLLAKGSAVCAGTAVWAALALALSACAPTDNSGSPSAKSTSSHGGSSSAADHCAPDRLHLVQPGTLTIGTSYPPYPPWFQHKDPTNGKGYESAVTYAVAHRLGFAKNDVRWVDVPFNSSYAPGSKKFDFDINQISITPKRAQVVDFSDGYYRAAQALIVLDSSPFATATSIADLKGARLGAQVGTTSLTAASDVIDPRTPVAVFDDTNAAKQALLNGQIDAIVVDLPTAFYITAAEIANSTIVGQFQPTSGKPEQFGMLFEKGNPLVQCVDQALATLKKSGQLKALEHRWLSSVVDVPELS
jgi:polar amino acid transport system substrate-binding protein